MSELKSTLYSIAVITILAGILDIFSQSGKLKKYSGYALSLAIIVTILTPLCNLLNNLPSSLDIDLKSREISLTQENQYLQSAFETAIKQNISEKINIPTDALSVKVSLYTEEGEKNISEVNISIVDKEYFRYNERITDYTKNAYGCTVIVRNSPEE